MTSDEIEAARTPNGGWTRDTLAMWGVPWPPPRGWKKRLLNDSEQSFVRFRADGWPYCPRCDEDELYSLAVPATIETIAGCYRCNWRPGGSSS